MLKQQIQLVENGKREAALPKVGKWAVAWTGFPHYARALVDALAVHIGPPEFVLVAQAHHATKTIPLQCGVVPTVIGPDEPPPVFDSLPEVFLFSGWSEPSIVKIARAVHRTNGCTMCMGDNFLDGTFRQWIGRLVYRFWYSRFISDVLVPGAMSQKFFEYLGQPSERIHHGMYTVDDAVFKADMDSEDRDIDVLYVGQFIPRKGIDTLAKALSASSTVKRAVFVGGSRNDLWFDPPPAVELLSFAGPEELSRLMRRSKVFVLPSLVDHWGVVVLEAAQSGCLLVTSSHVGANPELVGPSNGRVFERGDLAGLQQSIDELLTLNVQTEANGRRASVAMAARLTARASAEYLAPMIAARCGKLRNV